MSKIRNRGSEPVKRDTKARKVTDKRGGAIEPRDARARFTTRGRTQKDPDVRGIQSVPTGIEPVDYKGKASGSHQDNDIPTKTQRQQKVWRKSGDPKTKNNPLKGA